jgi:hypothetical protein
VTQALDADILSPSGRHLTVIREGDRLEAFDPDDPEFEPIPITPADLRSWRLDIDRFVALVRDQNTLDGPVGKLSDRCFLVGTKDDVTFVLAFVDAGTAAREMRGLSSLLPTGVPPQLAVACPTFTPPLEMQRECDRERIVFRSLNEIDPSLINPPGPSFAKAPEFEHSGNYDWVRVGQFEFTLNPTQAAVVRLLDEARLRGRSEVATAAVQATIAQTGSGSMKVSAVFRHQPDWRELIRYRRGAYRLHVV